RPADRSSPPWLLRPRASRVAFRRRRPRSWPPARTESRRVSSWTAFENGRAIVAQDELPHDGEILRDLFHIGPALGVEALPCRGQQLRRPPLVASVALGYCFGHRFIHLPGKIGLQLWCIHHDHGRPS